MKITGTLILTALLLSTFLLGCAGSGAVAPPSDNAISRADYKDLQARYDALQFNYDSLKRAALDSSELQLKYNALVDELRVLRVEKAALEGQVTSLNTQYNNAINALSDSQLSALKDLEAINQQLEQQKEWTRTIDEQLKLVQDKKVQLLSDNLTDSEYIAFYKGWELWWGTFND